MWAFGKPIRGVVLCVVTVGTQSSPWRLGQTRPWLICGSHGLPGTCPHLAGPAGGYCARCLSFSQLVSNPSLTQLFAVVLGSGSCGEGWEGPQGHAPWGRLPALEPGGAKFESGLCHLLSSESFDLLCVSAASWKIRWIMSSAINCVFFKIQKGEIILTKYMLSGSLVIPISVINYCIPSIS